MKADLHIHLDGFVTKENIIKFLELAEEQKLDVISFVEHNTINSYISQVIENDKSGYGFTYKDGPLAQMIRTGEVKKYFSGDIIVGTEISTLITNEKEPYNSYESHILFYNFDPAKLIQEKWFDKSKQEKLIIEDLKTFAKNCEKLGLPNPPIEKIFQESKKQLIPAFYAVHDWVISKPEITKKFIEKIKVDPKIFSTRSDFNRTLIKNPQSPLYVETKTLPTLDDLNGIKKRCGGEFVIAHPFAMNKRFSIPEYLDVVRSHVDISGIETDYKDNSNGQTEILHNYCKKNNIFETCGSDSQTTKSGTMYYINPKIGNEKNYYLPVPGVSAPRAFRGNPDIYLKTDDKSIGYVKTKLTCKFKPAPPFYNEIMFAYFPSGNFHDYIDFINQTKTKPTKISETTDNILIK